jgi:CheY-like chemotaxis protein
MAQISLIDDDFSSELIVQNLSLRGHSVLRYSSVDDALGEVENIAKSDLVILDLIMPLAQKASASNADGARSTGMHVFREVRRRNAKLPVLIFTANQDPAVIDVIAKDGNARYISRWSSPKFGEFVTIVHDMLGIESRTPSPRVFIVHGHDDNAKFEVKNYLQNVLHLPEPIILHEKPNMGRTLIEKFEELSACTELAFVILTPDDKPANATDGDSEKRRARQNVILELGFFLGKLGRHSGRVFLLHRGPVELPSDLSGVVYIDISNGVEAAGEQIRREIEAAQQLNNILGTQL